MKKLIFILGVCITLTLALCSCGEEEDTEPACEHSFEESVIAEPTCDADGIKTLTCTLCDEVYTKQIAALGHDTVEIGAKAPTCTEAGWGAYVECKICFYDNREVIAATGVHSYENSVCTVCGVLRPSEN